MPTREINRELALLVPSRGRPEHLKRLCASIAETAIDIPEVYVGVDEDDPKRVEYESFWYQQSFPFQLFVQPDCHQVVGWLNQMAAVTYPHHRNIGTVGDDNVFSTVGWEQAVIASLEDQRKKFGL